MRYLKAALVGVAAGVLLATLLLGFEILHAERSVSAQMPDCQTHVYSDRTESVCDSPMHVWGLANAFTLGFFAMFAWSLRRQRRPVA